MKRVTSFKGDYRRRSALVDGTVWTLGLRRRDRKMGRYCVDSVALRRQKRGR